MNLFILQNLDLLSVGITVAATIVLGSSVYFSNTKSITNKTFLWFTLVTAIWGVVTYVSYQLETPQLVLWLIRLVMFFAVFQAFTLFLFFKVFPQNDFQFSKKIRYILFPIVILTALTTLTKLVFPEIVGEIKAGEVPTVSKGPGLILFGVVAISLVVAGLYELISKMLKAETHERKSYSIIAIGASITFALIITFSFIIATIFNNPQFVPLGSLFFFPFIAFTSYSILQHKLFNVRAIWAGVLVFLLTTITFSEVILARELSLIFYRSTVFVLILLFGIMLIRGIIRQEHQREEIAELAGRLKSVNSILAHDVKGTLSKGRNMMSVLLEGLYGPIPEKARRLMEDVMNDWRGMLNAITNILAAGREMVLTVEPFNLKDAINEVIKEISKDAEAKHLTIKTEIPDGDYTITADKIQLTTHVLKNLIENAVNYNLENGTVTIGLSRLRQGSGGQARQDQDTFLFTVKDTGVGIKEEDRPNMFKEGGRGKNSIKINVHSTGYGLVAAKKTVEAHGGKIWFESEGIPGKGTTFFVELPVVTKEQNQAQTGSPNTKMYRI